VFARSPLKRENYGSMRLRHCAGKPMGLGASTHFCRSKDRARFHLDQLHDLAPIAIERIRG
jgi:hypothetical protein